MLTSTYGYPVVTWQASGITALVAILSRVGTTEENEADRQVGDGFRTIAESSLQPSHLRAC